MLEIRVKKLHEDAVVPSYAHATDTGFDLYTTEDTFIASFDTAIAKTGLAFDMPEGWGVMIRPRSGISFKGCPVRAIKLVKAPDIAEVTECNCNVTVRIGTVDEGYTGEIGIIVWNEEPCAIVIPKGTKLAQGVVERVYQATFTEVEELSDTDRGNGGFGSTGV